MPTDFPTKGDDQAITLRNSQYPQFDYDYAADLRESHPDIWRRGGNIRGNEAFSLWGKARSDSDTPAVLDWIKEREVWAARHEGDFRLAGVVAAVKWGVVVRRGEGYMKDLINEAKKKDRAEASAALSDWTVGAARDLPISEGAEWDGDAAARAIFAWAGFDTDRPDPSRARRGFLIYDPSAGTSRAAYKLPFATVRDGRLVASAAGLRAAASRLPQTDAPLATLDRARRVLDTYMARLRDDAAEASALEQPAPQHTGVIVALWPERETATQIATLPYATEQADNLHITVLYLGDSALLADRRGSIEQAIGAICAQVNTLNGQVSGVGRFDTVEEDGTNALWLAVDLPGLPTLRSLLMDALGEIGDLALSDEGYTPHITVAYTAPDAPMPEDEIPPFPLRFEAVTLAWGDERIPFALPPAPGESDPPTAPAGAPMPQDSPAQEMPLGLEGGVYRGVGALLGNYADGKDREVVTIVPPSDRIRLSLVSQIAGDTSAPRPVHALRVGTFTDMSGREVTFTPAHIRAIATNYNRRTPPRESPITRNHDYGAAFGRISRVWCDAKAENLYFQPWWNTAGAQLIIDRIYDGISCELNKLSDLDQIDLIGASLTNYPAVSGLHPVALSAPPLTIDPLAQQERIPMTDPTPQATASVSDIALSAALSDEMRQQMAQLTEQQRQMMQQQFTQMREMARQEAAAMFQRELAEMNQRQETLNFAQQATNPTTQRPYALPVQADKLAAFMAGLTSDQRVAFKDIITQTLTAGLVNFEEYGSGAGDGDQPSATERYTAALSAKKASGMTEAQAIQVLRREDPDLMDEYNSERAAARQSQQRTRKGGR